MPEINPKPIFETGATRNSGNVHGGAKGPTEPSLRGASLFFCRRAAVFGLYFFSSEIVDILLRAPVNMSGARTAGGLVCSHGSDLDMRIPRAKVPKSALPQSLRRKLGFEKKRPLGKQRASRYSEETNPYAAGANVLKPRESQDGKYAAGCQKNFLRRGSGVAMSYRASRKAQQEVIERRRTSSQPNQPVRETGYGAGYGFGNPRKHAPERQSNNQNEESNAQPRRVPVRRRPDASSWH